MLSMVLLFSLLGGGFILVQTCIGLVQWQSNNLAPRQMRLAWVVSKRTKTSFYHTGYSVGSVVAYFITVQFVDGSCQEFQVGRGVYRILHEGNRGTVTYKGTRFIRFEQYLKS